MYPFCYIQIYLKYPYLLNILIIHGSDHFASQYCLFINALGFFIMLTIFVSFSIFKEALFGLVHLHITCVFSISLSSLIFMIFNFLFFLGNLLVLFIPH